jgi:hypothetical protein
MRSGVPARNIDKSPLVDKTAMPSVRHLCAQFAPRFRKVLKDLHALAPLLRDSLVSQSGADDLLNCLFFDFLKGGALTILE